MTKEYITTYKFPRNNIALVKHIKDTGFDVVCDEEYCYGLVEVDEEFIHDSYSMEHGRRSIVHHQIQEFITIPKIVQHMFPGITEGRLIE